MTIMNDFTRKEYIEREQAVMKIREWFWSAPGVHPKLDRDAAEELLFSLHASDVAPVVRCGECENWQTDWKPGSGKDETHFCAMVGLCTSADWFCADGERKDGDGDV